MPKIGLHTKCIQKIYKQRKFESKMFFSRNNLACDAIKFRPLSKKYLAFKLSGVYRIWHILVG